MVSVVYFVVFSANPVKPYERCVASLRSWEYVGGGGGGGSVISFRQYDFVMSAVTAPY